MLLRRFVATSRCKMAPVAHSAMGSGIEKPEQNNLILFQFVFVS
jgi:hypothetical protein